MPADALPQSTNVTRGELVAAQLLRPQLAISEEERQRIVAKPKSKRRQGIFWILTIPHHGFTPFLPPSCKWIRGQLELGAGGFLHWQILVAFRAKQSLQGCRGIFGEYHCELSRSDAAADYVWKEDTRVDGTQFQLGTRPLDPSSSTDWDEVWNFAVAGAIESIPASVRIRSYHALCRISQHYQRPTGMARQCRVFWGVTGSGKSHRAWQEAGDEGYSKDPRSKFWCGYRGQSNVVIDEFRGGIPMRRLLTTGIDISHLLRWLDCYPLCVETKGGAQPYDAKNIWITSNLHPSDWYKDIDHVTYAALLRKIEITEFTEPYLPE